MKVPNECSLINTPLHVYNLYKLTRGMSFQTISKAYPRLWMTLRFKTETTLQFQLETQQKVEKINKEKIIQEWVIQNIESIKKSFISSGIYLNEKLGSGRFGLIFNVHFGGQNKVIKICQNQKWENIKELREEIFYGTTLINIQKIFVSDILRFHLLPRLTQTLQDFFEGKTVNEVLPTLITISSLLKDLHKRKIYHGDLHSENVMNQRIDFQLNWKLIDFTFLGYVNQKNWKNVATDWNGLLHILCVLIIERREQARAGNQRTLRFPARWHSGWFMHELAPPYMKTMFELLVPVQKECKIDEWQAYWMSEQERVYKNWTSLDAIYHSLSHQPEKTRDPNEPEECLSLIVEQSNDISDEVVDNSLSSLIIKPNPLKQAQKIKKKAKLTGKFKCSICNRRSSKRTCYKCSKK